MNIRPFTKGTKIKELIANTQNRYSMNIPFESSVVENLLITERHLNNVIRGDTFDPISWTNHLNAYNIDKDNYIFYSGHKLKPGVEYMMCLLNTYTPVGHVLLKNIDLNIPKIKHEYLANIGIFVYRYDPRYTDSMVKNESVIDSYCIFNLNGDYLAPNKPAPRPIEDTEYLQSAKRHKNKIKELDRDNILSSEEKALLFKSNFFDNIYNDYCEYIRLIKTMIATYDIANIYNSDHTIERLINNTTIDIIEFNISMITTITRKIPDISPALYSRELSKCPIDIPRSLELIATREDEIYHFHAEAPITHKPDIEYKAIPSITYTTS